MRQHTTAAPWRWHTQTTLRWVGRHTPWWLAVFLVALVVRVVYVLTVDPPFASPTSPQLLWGAMRLAARAELWREVLVTDNWREWNGWTIAPLYPLFLTLLVKIVGAHLILIRMVHALLDALVAVGVASLGRAVGGPRGTWAGMVLAFFLPSVMLSSEVLTECLHTPLLVAGLVCLVRAVTDARAGRSAASAAVGGALFGLSALARVVSSAFLPIAALWTVFECGWRRGVRLASLFVGSAALIIVPWLVRNYSLYGRYVPIETVSVFNLWQDNAAGNPSGRQMQARDVVRCKHTACSSVQAVAYTIENVVSAPGAYLDRVRGDWTHLWRPESIRMWLVAELPVAWWWHVIPIIFGDGIFFVAQALFLAFMLAPPRQPAHRLLVLWAGYYVFLITVPFHSEIRYRSALTPFLIAAAWGGWAALGRRPLRGLGRRQQAALAIGSLWAAWQLVPYVEPLSRVVASAPPLWRAHTAIEQQRFADARREIEVAAARDPGAARPWRRYGGWLARAGQPLLAAEAYKHGAQQATGTWLATLVPSLQRDAGRPSSPTPVTGEGLGLDQGGWRSLEAAWHELPPLRADCVTLGQNDFGMARGFYGHTAIERWTSRQAWLRLVPRRPADEHRVVLWMDSGPLTQPAVSVRVGRDEPHVFRVGREPAAYEMRARVAPGQPVLVQIESPTLTTSDAAPEQGVRVWRICVQPVTVRSE
jgi:hypothetical protein